MNQEASLTDLDVLDLEALQKVHNLWNQGMQDEAIDVLRQRIEAGSSWGAAFAAWLSLQNGSLEWLERGLDFAIHAADAGYAVHGWAVFNNAIGMLINYPHLADRVIEVVRRGYLAGNVGIDLLGQAWNVLNAGQNELALRLMKVRSPLPVQFTEVQLQAMVPRAQEQVDELVDLLGIARQRDTEVVAALGEVVRSARDIAASERIKIETVASEAGAAMDKARNELETRAKQAGLLVSSATSEATNALYVAEAKRNTKESRTAWGFGLGILGVAALVAVLPVVLHYLRIGPNYSSFEQIALHLVSTAALASWAGVMLARARSRDQAAQRAHDLSTAMGTMINYSGQIRDNEERERFMTLMGQMVLQAHLATNTKGGSGEDSLAGMLALMNMVKPTAVATPNS